MLVLRQHGIFDDSNFLLLLQGQFNLAGNSNIVSPTGVIPKIILIDMVINAFQLHLIGV